MEAHAQEHLPVMVGEVLEGLRVLSGQWYLDGTFGAGGHSRAILAAGGNVLGLDQDPLAETHYRTLAAEFPERTRFVRGNFRDMEQHVRETGLETVAGVLLDLGVSSMQLDRGERGFAFRQDGPLDMRMGEDGLSAAELIAETSSDALAELIYRYGEERHSRRIARAIKDAAPISSTAQLAEVVARAYPGGYRREHPARRTFQALRIAVNDELGALQDALVAALRVLAPDGRLVVLSYHSLEDRIVKHFVRSSLALLPLTKRPLSASDEEIEANPRARSAKLRVAEKRAERGPE